MMKFEKDQFNYIIKMINSINRIKTIDWVNMYFFTFLGEEMDTAPSLLWFLNIILYKLCNKNLWVNPDHYVKIREDMEYPEKFWKYIDNTSYTLRYRR